ncbi:glycosyltransferase [Jidongwangia harbinensis]|uniref:glycosyltransferase n=1 Tax=Jidongwangia harbinensis TaxID=2878561 RepID=UPI001CDA2524|nr:glycosyltransferase [Jidongwangia harbinensis]MCA2215142.1 glycosyltransferase [Jidongwangia harbinensis]
MSATVYDVAILSDLRYPGGNSASIVAEVQAQAAAGVSTVLIHVPSPHLRHARPFHPRIVACLRDGLADLAHDGDPVDARLLVIRQPRIFTHDLAVPPVVRADRTVLVVNQPPGDAADDQCYYAVAEVRERITRYFGPDVAWAPISPPVREHLQRVAPDLPLPRTDWHEIIDVREWWADRDGPVGAVPVIGRHGRPDPVKWPRDPEQIRQAYPDSGDVRVRILGGAEIAAARIGGLPSNWEAVEFGAEQPRDFLRTIDVFVYFHDPRWVEALGRTILEAMATGVPVIVGEHFRGTFGDAALYAEPAGVRDLARALHADRARYQLVVKRAREFVERRYGSDAHLSRLGLRPSRRSHPVPAPRPAPAPARPATRVLLLGDQPDRLLAIARRLPGDLAPVLVTGSPRLPPDGPLTEYLPSRAALDVRPARWSGFLRDRLRHLIALHHARAVVLDGLPHDGVLAATADHPDVAWLWIRPAMWRRGTGLEWQGRAAAFDAVLAPGEFAAAGDEGWTVADRTPVTEVPPITRLDRGDLLDRDAARAAAGVTGEPALLLRGVSAAVPEFRVIEADAGALRAADLAVAAADYTTFHELLAATVPTVFVPDPAATDDQLARARFAAAAGAALCAEPGADLADVLTVAARSDVRAALARRCADLAFDNGAAAAAAWIGAHCGAPARIGA